MKTFLVCLATSFFLVGCQIAGESKSAEETELPASQSAAGSQSTPASQSASIEATSLLGVDLFRPVLPEEFRKQQESLLAEARSEQLAAPNVVEPWIWIGRRTAYLGRYGEAIEVYSEAIDKFPEEPRLYRHRGHRYLSIRKFDQAIADFEQAAALFEDRPDVVEPDGLPNDRGIPTSTLQSNVWYHLGLAHFLKGDFEQALDAYRKCLEVSKNPDMLVATTYWLTMTLRRLGRFEEAEQLLEPITAEMDIIENRDYHRLLLMAKGQDDPDRLLADARAAGGLSLPSTGFGVGQWLLSQGSERQAAEVFREVVEGDSWSAFGYIAAEAELARNPGLSESD